MKLQQLNVFPVALLLITALQHERRHIVLALHRGLPILYANFSIYKPLTSLTLFSGLLDNS